ncbi:hypothetical protein [Halosimplex amylolyticum]|uniref:hypothetical protein n=1 Tax=Halosimplex amylolyticum TaxID=3396616 RepID=UPI003F565358
MTTIEVAVERLLDANDVICERIEGGTSVEFDPESFEGVYRALRFPPVVQVHLMDVFPNDSMS